LFTLYRSLRAVQESVHFRFLFYILIHDSVYRIINTFVNLLVQFETLTLKFT